MVASVSGDGTDVNLREDSMRNTITAVAPVSTKYQVQGQDSDGKWRDLLDKKSGIGEAITDLDMYKSVFGTVRCLWKDFRITRVVVEVVELR